MQKKNLVSMTITSHFKNAIKYEVIFIAPTNKEAQLMIFVT